MPGGDGTGPMGYGPRSGRAAGYCAGYGMPGFANPWPRRRFRGRGYGYGYGYAAPAPDAGAYAGEKEYLKEQAEYLKEEISMLEARLKELENTAQQNEE
ncbi:MAG TPA: hypothetical protein ENN91_00820 [Firmicutes bacterium]|nr:hypothetical protein [Bacillota bacterium]